VAYRLHEGACVVGAGNDAHFVLEDDTVSRRHAELKLVPEGIEVVDLGSRNGTFYHDQRVQHMVLRLGSRLRLGRVELALEPDQQPSDHSPLRDVDHYGALFGSSDAMRRLYALLERLEGSLVPVLLRGESGTGKEVVARLLHERSLVGKGPFVAVNCGLLDRTLARSELFGHARGSFTGATENHAGAFEAAANGTLFLDEIGELPLDVQPVLLRALELGVVQRVGETVERPIRVRLIAATNRKLDELVKAGKFREDLYYRLLVVQVELPPLRARAADIPALVRRFAAELGVHSIDDEVIAELTNRPWPGNVRELKNAVRAYLAVGSVAPAMAASSPVLDEALRESIDLSRPYSELKERVLERFQSLYLELLLARTGGNQSEAARVSGLDRSYLNRVIKRLGDGA
jgi:DNA-binding NtrC family response regulator